MTDEADQSTRERQLQEDLQGKGIAILQENPNYETNGLVRYRLLCKHRDSGGEFEVLGENREHALLAAVTTANATA